MDLRAVPCCRYPMLCSNRRWRLYRRLPRCRLRSLLSVALAAVLSLLDVLVGDVEVLGHLVNRCGIDFLGLLDQLFAPRLITLNELIKRLLGQFAGLVVITVLRCHGSLLCAVCRPAITRASWVEFLGWPRCPGKALI